MDMAGSFRKCGSVTAEPVRHRAAAAEV